MNKRIPPRFPTPLRTASMGLPPQELPRTEAAAEKRTDLIDNARAALAYWEEKLEQEKGRARLKGLRELAELGKPPKGIAAVDALRELDRSISAIEPNLLPFVGLDKGRWARLRARGIPSFGSRTRPSADLNRLSQPPSPAPDQSRPNRRPASCSPENGSERLDGAALYLLSPEGMSRFLARALGDSSFARRCARFALRWKARGVAMRVMLGAVSWPFPTFSPRSRPYDQEFDDGV